MSPLYRLTPRGEVVEPDRVRDEGRMQALIGTALVMGRPRDFVVRRVPSRALVESVDEPAAVDGPSWSMFD